MLLVDQSYVSSIKKSLDVQARKRAITDNVGSTPSKQRKRAKTTGNSTAF